MEGWGGRRGHGAAVATAVVLRLRSGSCLGYTPINKNLIVYKIINKLPKLETYKNNYKVYS